MAHPAPSTVAASPGGHNVFPSNAFRSAGSAPAINPNPTNPMGPTAGSGIVNSPIVEPNQTPTVTDGSVPSTFDQLIFGSSGGSAGFAGPTSSPQTSGTQQLTLEFLLSLLRDTVGDSSGLGPGAVGFQDQFGGQIPGTNVLQALSLSGLEKTAGGELDIFAGTIGQDARRAISDLLSTEPQDFGAVFDATVAAPAQQDLRRAFEEINLSAVGSGNLFGSERTEQVGRTTQDFLTGLSRERTRFAFDSNQAAIQTMLEALGLVPSIAGLDVGIGRDLFAAGTDARTEELKTFGIELGLFQSDRAREDQLLNMLLGGSIAPTFGVSGGFALGNTGSSSGGFVDSFVSSLLGGNR